MRSLSDTKTQTQYNEAKQKGKKNEFKQLMNARSLPYSLISVN